MAMCALPAQHRASRLREQRLRWTWVPLATVGLSFLMAWWCQVGDPMPPAPVPAGEGLSDPSATAASTTDDHCEHDRSEARPAKASFDTAAPDVPVTGTAASRCGLVLDPHGQPLAGARVRNTTSLATVVTNDQGSFVWSGNRGLLAADVEHFTCVRLADLARPDAPVILMFPEAKTTVRVVDLSGAPLPGAHLTVTPRWDPMPLGGERGISGALPGAQAFVSDDTGCVHIGRATGMPYEIVVTKPGYAPAASWLAGDDTTITIQPARAIAGMVADAYGNPVAGARIEVMATAGSSTWSDASGRFVLEHVPSVDDVGILCRHANHAPQARIHAAADAGPVQFFLPRPFTLSGRVVDRDGVGCVGAMIHVVDAASPADPLWRSAWPDWRNSLVVRADANGMFAINGLPPDEYELCAFDPVDSNRSDGCRVAVPGQQALLRLAAGARSMDVQLCLRSLVDSAPVSSCRLQFLEVDGNTTAVQARDLHAVDGRYRFAATRRDCQFVCVSAPDFAEAIVPLSPASDRDPIEVWLHPVMTTTLRLTDSRTGLALTGEVLGRDAAGRPLRLGSPTAGMAHSVQNGICELLDAPSGPLSFRLVDADQAAWNGATTLSWPCGRGVSVVGLERVR